MYESPIRLDFVEPTVRQLDDCIMESVSSVGITVDRDELLKALQYDRDQYRVGYEEGYQAAKRELISAAKSELIAMALADDSLLHQSQAGLFTERADSD